MNRGLIWGIASVGVAVAIVFGAHTLINSTPRDICTNRIDGRATAPDGRADAVAFTRDCGRDGGISAHVSLLPPGTALPNLPGSVYRAVRAPDAPVQSVPWVRVGWTAPDRLVIVHNEDSQAFVAEQVIGAIAVQYGTMDVPPSADDLAAATEILK